MRIPFLSKNEEFVLVEQTDQSARYVVVRSSGDALKLLAAGEVVDANEEVSLCGGRSRSAADLSARA